MEIATPVADASEMDVDHEPVAPPCSVPPPAPTAPAQATAAGAPAAAQPATLIPAASYTMPPPTWRVKSQFANWEVDHTRFEVKRLLGKGSYGSVAEAVDHLTGQRVAIKKIPGVFEVFENAKRIYREIRIVRMLQHTNIIKIVHVQQPNDLLNFTDLYVIFECLDTDAAKLIRDETQCLTVPHVRWFLYQLLLAVKFIHSARVLHRDIKPANILLTESCDLKLCDFGLARSLDGEGDDDADAERDIVGVQQRMSMTAVAVGAGGATNGTAAAAGGGAAPAAVGAAAGAGATGGAAAAGAMSVLDGVSTIGLGDASMSVGSVASSATSGGGGGGGLSAAGTPLVQRVMTKHVVTRWYRAPELPLYNDGEYSTAIDVWSVGCCYAELLGMLDTGTPECRYDRRALFPGGACFPMSKDRSKDRSGKEKKDQLAVIFEVLGTPTEDEVRRGVRTQAAAEYLRSLKPRKPEDLNKRYPTAGREATDLLRAMLRFNPGDRITMDEALAHPFLAPVRRPHDEVARAEGAVHVRRAREDTVRDLIVEEIRAYNPHIPPNWKELAAAQSYAGWPAGTSGDWTPGPDGAS